MAKIYYEKDTDVNKLKGKKIAIIGYGSQGHAQAQNLRDSGMNVVVADMEGSDNWKQAEVHGWKPLSTPDAVKDADWIQILVPDDIQKKVWESQILPNLKPNAVIGFSHGFSIRFHQIEPPETCDVVMVAPKGPGHLVRRMYEEGKGVPDLVAVEHNASGQALDLALAYAAGIGGARAGIIETTFTEETETDLFGEQVVLCGGVVELVVAGFETLVNAGYQPEIAYFECLSELKLITDMVYEGGIGWMNYSISDTAEYGEYSRGKRIITNQTREEMKKILGEIRSGEFANEWIEEAQSGKPNLMRAREALSKHQIEQVGKQLRGMMPWLGKKS